MLAFLGESKVATALTVVCGIIGVFLIPVGDNLRFETFEDRVDSNAISKAWQKVADGQYSDDRIHWFLGFIEGRFLVEPPKWWKDSVQSLRTRDKNNVFFSPSERLPHGINIKVEGESFVLHFVEYPKDQLRLSKTKLSAIPEVVRVISGAVDETRFYIAIHSLLSEEFDLVCYDRNGAVVWTATIDGAKYMGQQTGFGFAHNIDVIICNDSVLIFGVSNEAIYIEQLSKQEGRSLMKFSSLESRYRVTQNWNDGRDLPLEIPSKSFKKNP